jgi:hypothetical protein
LRPSLKLAIPLPASSGNLLVFPIGSGRSVDALDQRNGDGDAAWLSCGRIDPVYRF